MRLHTRAAKQSCGRQTKGRCSAVRECNRRHKLTGQKKRATRKGREEEIRPSVSSFRELNTEQLKLTCSLELIFGSCCLTHGIFCCVRKIRENGPMEYKISDYTDFPFVTPKSEPSRTHCCCTVVCMAGGVRQSEPPRLRAAFCCHFFSSQDQHFFWGGLYFYLFPVHQYRICLTFFNDF